MKYVEMLKWKEVYRAYQMVPKSKLKNAYKQNRFMFEQQQDEIIVE